MKNGYFYRKSIIYFSAIVFVLIALVLIFVNIKTNSIYKYVNLKMQEETDESYSLVEKHVEKDIQNYIEGIRVKNILDLKNILKNPTYMEFIKNNRISELSSLINATGDSFLIRELEIDDESKKENYEYSSEGLSISSEESIIIGNKKIFVRLNGKLKKDFLKSFKRGFITRTGMLDLNAPSSKKYKEKFISHGVEKIVEENSYLKNVSKIYIPYYSPDNKLSGIIFYEIDRYYYGNINEDFSIEVKNMIKNINIYVIIFSLSFSIATMLLIQFLFKRIFSPLGEVFRIIDELSKGKYGKKIFISENKELRPLVKKINRLSGNLDFINRIKNEFLIKKSYEFKEVLDNIVGMSHELIKNRKIEKDLKDELRIIYDNSSKLLNITRGLNDYYILEDDTVRFDENVNLKKLIEEAGAVLTNDLKDKKLYINNLISEKIYVKGDSIKLFILFTNILENAIKNSFEDDIIVEAIEENSGLVVSVRDKGRGIEKSKLTSIKEYLKGNEEVEDIGLGFVLAKRIAELHGGKVDISSELGEGTKILIRLQEAHNFSDKNKDKLEEIKKEIELDSIYGKNSILIYCNNYLNCQILANFLKSKNYILNIVENKEDLFDFLKTKKVEVLILDVLGDFNNDYKLIKEIRAEKLVKDLSIIFINNRKKMDEDFSIFDLGVNDVLDKPLLKDELIIKIENQLALINTQKMNRTLEEEKEIVESINNIQKEISENLDTKKIFNVLLKNIKEIVDFDSALILGKRNHGYHIVFQEGALEKEDKTNKSLKEKFLDMIVNKGKIVKLSRFKSIKYLGEKTKSALIIPFGYRDNISILVLKSNRDNELNSTSKTLIDRLFNNLSNSVKNAELFGELEEKNEYLSDLLDMLKSIDKLISVVYKEQDRSTAVYYILLILINKLKFGYKEAYYFEFNNETNYLNCSNYFYSLKNYTEEKENKVSTKELWSKKIKLKLEKNNLLTRAFKDEKSYYLKELTTEDYELFGKMLKVTILPVKYLDEKFGLIVLESDRRKKGVDEIEKEALRIISANLGIYLHNKELEKDSVRLNSNKTLNTFAKAIIHELRTPVVGVKGFASIVKEKYAFDKKLNAYMDKIIDDSNRVLELSGQIVDYAEEKNLVYTYIEDNVRQTIHEVLEEFMDYFKLEEVEVSQPLEDLYLVYDKNKLKRVFRHIIKNSLENIDYDKEKFIIKIGFEKNQNGLSNIVFYDNGVGIDEENIKNIFEPLVSGKIQGTGLGLPISKSIIEKHNWDLKLESVKFNYTKVTIITK